jgi:hypothetical protein
MMQKTYLGGFEIYHINKKNSMLPQYTRLFSIATEEKITSAKYIKKGSGDNLQHLFYFSMHSGKLLKYSFAKNFKTKVVRRVEVI